MLLSIIVPVYNVEAYLRKCLDSILEQDFHDFEVLLVDDGSTDSSRDLCDEYALKYENVRVIHKENKGLSSTWFVGIHEVTGDYVCSIDSDDYIDQGMLRRISGVILSDHPDIVVYGYKTEKNGTFVNNELGVAEGLYDKSKIESIIIPGLINSGVMKRRSNIYLSRINKVINRELLMDNHVFYRDDINYGEDNLWTIPNVLKAQSIYVMANYYPYNYRWNPSSISRKYNKGLWDKFLDLDEHILYMLESLNRTDLNVQVYRDIVYHATVSINNEMRSGKRRKAILNEIRSIILDSYVRMGLNEFDIKSIPIQDCIIITLMKLGSAKLIYLYRKVRLSFLETRLV